MGQPGTYVPRRVVTGLKKWWKPTLASTVALGVALHAYWPVLTGNLRAVRLSEWEAGKISERQPIHLEDGSRMPSPDGSMYIVTQREVKRRTFEVHRTGDGRLIGRFSGGTVQFLGWADDSSGFYVSVFLPASLLRPSTWWFGAPGPLSKVRIPGR